MKQPVEQFNRAFQNFLGLELQNKTQLLSNKF